ncbi:MAG TPA: hypothetical protein VFZ24_10760 [Longimicrobiales bacterium]
MGFESEEVIIARRYRGPPDSANGGYACGLVARHIDGSARVRLNVPPPLEQPLTIRMPDPAHATMLLDEQVVAEGVGIESDGEIPEPVDVETAIRSSQKFRWRTGHPFAGCFVCGPARHAGDGLCIFPGPVAERRIVAAPWVPDPSVCDANGIVHREVVWAALDCPSWFGLLEFEPGTTVGLLGQLAVHIVRRPTVRESCVAIGWSSGRSGRKLRGGAALYTSDGVLLGSSSAIWIEPKESSTVNAV